MFQQTIVIGNLGGDPEMRYLEDGTPVTTFSMASNQRWKTDEGEDREKTTWFRVTSWRGLAETVAKYLKKGRQVMVTGTITASAWVNEDGEAQASLELTAREVKFLGSGNGNRPPELSEEALEELGEEIPF